MSRALENNELRLEAVEKEFKSWRSTRKRGERIPTALWEKAVSLTERYSAGRISRTLDLGWPSFQKRLCQKKGIPYKAPIVGASGQDLQSSVSPFIEVKISKNANTSNCGSSSLLAPSNSSPCIVELTNASGGSLKIYSSAVEQLDINLNLVIERFLSPNPNPNSNSNPAV
ncbi:MAG: hypothetical protein GY757_01925 [bacterium]|nr:hypothetical protein [bacterium]